MGSRVLIFSVVFDDLLGRDRRAVALASAQRLGVVRLVAVHPADDRLFVEVLQGIVVLFADDRHAMPLQFVDLLLGRSLPKAHVQIDAKGLVLGSVAGVLQPDGDGEHRLVLAGAIGPAGVGIHFSLRLVLLGNSIRGVHGRQTLADNNPGQIG